MMEIASWFAGRLALITAVLIMLHDDRRRQSIKAFISPFVFNSMIYFYYTIAETTADERQFITRLGVITYCLTTIIILLVARRK